MSTTAAPRAPVRIELSEELMIMNRQQLKQRVVDLIADGSPNVILDASKCGYIDSSGLGVLISLTKKCRDAGGVLVLYRLTDEMRAFLEFTNLHTVLTIDATHGAP